MRRCAHCGVSKDEDSFYASSGNVCKECFKARRRQRLRSSPYDRAYRRATQRLRASAAAEFRQLMREELSRGEKEEVS